MNSKYEKILSYYEDIKLHTGTLSGKEGFFEAVAFNWILTMWRIDS